MTSEIKERKVGKESAEKPDVWISDVAESDSPLKN